MPQELIERSKDQRQTKRFEEALVSAMAATKAAPDDAEAWWEVALSRLALKDNGNAIPALRRVIELAPRSDNAMARLGSALIETGDEAGAVLAFRQAFELNPENQNALESLSDYLSRKNDLSNDDEELSILHRIEKLSYLSDWQLNRAGINNYNKGHLYEAIRYWRRAVVSKRTPASIFNLGLAYSQPQIGQVADAVDMWRFALYLGPEYEPPKNSLARIIPDEEKVAEHIRGA
jgi:tetratricopeptide (TPR) repeat protein